jgi:hypothetical protein
MTRPRNLRAVKRLSPTMPRALPQTRDWEKAVDKVLIGVVDTD